MQIDKSTVDKIASLARLEVEDTDKMITEMSKILTFMDKLNELDTDAVAPLVYMNEEVNVLRDDNAKLSITRDDALKNAPKSDGEYFRVPKVIDLKP